MYISLLAREPDRERNRSLRSLIPECELNRGYTSILEERETYGQRAGCGFEPPITDGHGRESEKRKPPPDPCHYLPKKVGGMHGMILHSLPRSFFSKFFLSIMSLSGLPNSPFTLFSVHEIQRLGFLGLRFGRTQILVLF
jgi:hypothetical protein